MSKSVFSNLIKKTLLGVLVLNLFSFVAVKAEEAALDFGTIFDDHPSVKLLIDVETATISRANKSAASFYGYSKEVLETMALHDINMMSSLEIERMNRAAAANEQNRFIFPQRLKDGTVRTVEVFSHPVSFGGTQKLYFTLHDVSAVTQQNALIGRQQIVIFASIGISVSMLFIFTGVLNLNLRRRRKAENVLSKKLELERMLAVVSSSFVSSTANNLHSKLEEMVAFVGKELEADRCYFIEFSSDRKSSNVTHEWCREGIEPHKQFSSEVMLEDFPSFSHKGLSGEFIYIPDVNQMTEEEHLEREMLESLGIKSILGIPLLHYGRVRAYLGFDLRETGRKFTEEELASMKLLANILSDALEKNMMEIRLSDEKERLEITISSVGDGIIALDRDDCIEFINPVAQSITGWTKDEALGKSISSVYRIIDRYTKELALDPLNLPLKSDREESFDMHSLLLSKEGKQIAISQSVSPILDKHGNIRGKVLVFRDVTEELVSIEKIEYLSFHDQLTDLYNRHFFEAELKRLDTARNLPISLVIADVNGLKLANDAFGHQVGDELLKKTAEVLKSQCRADEIIARIGGDEFVIILPKTDLEEVKKITSRIQEKTKEVFVGSIGLSVSIGWACKENIETDLMETLKMAEKLMYQHKLIESPSMRVIVLQSIVNALYAKNIKKELHSKRVSKLNAKLGYALGLNKQSIEELKNTGMLHDVGKIAIPDKILNKSEGLTPEERLEVNRHPEIGYHILSSVSGMSEIAQIVLAHHERWDGKGYPKGLKKEEIPLQARITSVATVYDFIVSDHPYRKAFSHQEALEEIKRNAGTQFDPEVVKIFVEVVAEEEVLEEDK